VKGIILAGGSGTRLWPTTKSVSKQLLPIYDKPLIYYPLSTLMLAGINEILIITTPSDQNNFKNLLGDGTQFGISLKYEVQIEPNGLAQAFVIGSQFIANESVSLILGDNLFYGSGLSDLMKNALTNSSAHIFTYEVSNPQDYGIVFLDELGNPIRVEEKPASAKSNLAITGLYFFNNEVVEIAKKVKPSARGEFEITSVIEHYLKEGNLSISTLSRGMAWLDTGSSKTLHDAASFVRVIEERTGTKIGCIEEVAWRNGWINSDQLYKLGTFLEKSEYGKYLQNLVLSN